MDNTTNSLAEKSRLRQMIDSYGVPRMIITGFLLLMFVLVPFAGVDFATQISNVINRFSWNAIMVLAMVPMVHSGCGLNFGLPLGIISGLLGATLSIELGFTGPMSFVMAIAIATPFALLLGGGYGWLLNKIKGGEMMVATYVGFSSVSFMCMMWLLLPYKKPRWCGASPAPAFVPPSPSRASMTACWRTFSPSTSTASASTSSFRPAA